jgi:peptidoglycan hydrolase CwlO-like protein
MNIKKLQSLHQKLDDIRCSLEDVKAAAEEVYDNRSDNWKEGDKGQAEQERIEYLENAISEIWSVLDSLDNASASND